MMEAGPKRQLGNKSTATGSPHTKCGPNSSTYPNSHINSFDLPLFNLGGSNRTPHTTTTQYASMEASFSVSFREITKANTRANDHPEMVDMTEVVMSINFPPSPLSLNQDDIPLHHRRGSTDSVNHPRLGMDGPNNQIGDRPNIRGAWATTVGTNMVTSANIEDAQHDELQRVQLTCEPYVQELSMPPQCHLPHGNGDPQLCTLDSTGRPLSVPSGPINEHEWANRGRRPKKNKTNHLGRSLTSKY
ncbi:hypothetical protein FXO37_06406 [Capsicum annuum]|nr:hypothetical protein FXO37_06406 [Capsicum annuum]